MDFTREPIIETIISPKEGCKLLVRSSKSADSAEEHYVDALEVVSFGHAFFFRSLEKPKPFLVPTSDYEVLEVKEPRVMLKAAVHEKNIKIGGGRESPVRQAPRETPPVVTTVEEEVSAVSEDQDYARLDRRRDRRRRRHRRDDQEWTGSPQQAQETEGESSSEVLGEVPRVALVPSYPALIPPPLTLISQTLSRYKESGLIAAASPIAAQPFLPEELHEELLSQQETKEQMQLETEESGEGSETVERPRVDDQDNSALSSLPLTSLLGENDPYFF